MENKDLEERIARLEKLHIWGITLIGAALIGIYVYKAGKRA